MYCVIKRHVLRNEVIKNTLCVRVRVELENGGRCGVGSTYFLNSNSVLLKKLNSNSLTPCERI